MITLRVPANRFDDARDALRKLCLRVDFEKTEANDVTRQYVDTEARIRNLRAEEAQYLQILKSAAKVKDMLDVNGKLGEVRGEIEQQQAEFRVLSRQVETAALTLSLRVEAMAPAARHWKFGHSVSLAMRDAFENLTNYIDVLVAFLG